MANDLTVRETDDEAILGTLVLVLRLAAEAFALAVVGLPLAAAAEFDLVALVVRLGFLDFNEYLFVCGTEKKMKVRGLTRERASDLTLPLQKLLSQQRHPTKAKTTSDAPS